MKSRQENLKELQDWAAKNGFPNDEKISEIAGVISPISIKKYRDDLRVLLERGQEEGKEEAAPAPAVSEPVALPEPAVEPEPVVEPQTPDEFIEQIGAVPGGERLAKVMSKLMKRGVFGVNTPKRVIIEGEGGITRDLEVVTANPAKMLVREQVPTDIVTVMIAGKPVEVDLVELEAMTPERQTKEFGANVAQIRMAAALARGAA